MKLSLCWLKYHAMKTCGKRGIVGGGQSASHSSPFISSTHKSEGSVNPTVSPIGYACLHQTWTVMLKYLASQSNGQVRYSVLVAWVFTYSRESFLGCGDVIFFGETHILHLQTRKEGGWTQQISLEHWRVCHGVASQVTVWIMCKHSGDLVFWNCSF